MDVDQKDHPSTLKKIETAKVLPPAFPPDWAVEWGEDKYGLFAVLEVKEAVQRFRWLMPGTFTMGSPTGELERNQDEIEHSVALTKGFWLADTACSQALWMAAKDSNPSHFQDDSRLPVENVSWHNAQAFLEALNATNDGLNARLPTEAEWEYACRAGDKKKSPYSFGATINSNQVNFNGDFPYADGKKGEYRGKTVPVKSLPPNAWGLYEMHGNVWEWCQDWYGDYAGQPQIDPQGPENGSSRVLHGGSWFGDAGDARSAYRHWLDPDFRGSAIGFRLALG